MFSPQRYTQVGSVSRVLPMPKPTERQTTTPLQPNHTLLKPREVDRELQEKDVKAILAERENL